MRNARKRSRRQAGFTLMELIVVIAIIGILGTVVSVGVIRYVKDAKVAKVQADFQAFEQSCKMYKMDMGRWPNTLADLVQNPGAGKKWKGPYLEGSEIPKDPWENEYTYERPNTSTDLPRFMSYGADNAPGGDAEDGDIDSKNKNMD